MCFLVVFLFVTQQRNFSGRLQVKKNTAIDETNKNQAGQNQRVHVCHYLELNNKRKNLWALISSIVAVKNTHRLG
jgi:hypothetical protein